MAKGYLYIEYPYDKSGVQREQPTFHDLNKITVREGSQHSYCMSYELERGERVLLHFEPNGITAFVESAAAIVDRERLSEVLKVHHIARMNKNDSKESA